MLDKTRDRVPAGRFDEALGPSNESTKSMRHIISLLVENESGALSRIANMFSARGYNIEALSVAPTDDDTVSRMTVVTSGTDEIIEQIIKQLNKLVDVIKLIDLTESTHIERELMLVKVNIRENEVTELMQLIDVFRGHVIDVTDNVYTAELTGDAEKLKAFLHNLEPFDLAEVVRSGPLGIARGDRALRI